MNGENKEFSWVWQWAKGQSHQHSEVWGDEGAIEEGRGEMKQ
jgi:hypothetical protein